MQKFLRFNFLIILCAVIITGSAFASEWCPGKPGSPTLSWSWTNGPTSCSAIGSGFCAFSVPGSLPGNGSDSKNITIPGGTSDFSCTATLSCGGGVQSSDTLTWSSGKVWDSGSSACVVAPTISTFSASKINILVGETYNLTLGSSNAASCQVKLNGVLWSNLGGSNTWNGLAHGSAGSYTYDATCYSGAGQTGVQSSVSSVTITVTSADCTGTPWGTVTNGSSVTGYQSATPAGSCVSQTRTCTAGSLSGSYSATSCTAGCASTPWGNVTNGYSNTAYQSATPSASCASVSETRTCSGGSLSGSYGATSCTSGCTGTPWGDVSTGYSGTAYQNPTVPFGSSCVSQTRTCTAGSMSGSYGYASCSVDSPVDCTGTPWGTISDGSSVTAYQSSSPAGSCVSQTRTCTGGSLSGSYSATSCTPGCTSTPWGSVSDGYSNTAYQSASVPFGSSCVSQTRSCSSGSMSGSYGYTSCSVDPPLNCTGTPWGTVNHGSSVTAYQSASPAGSCTSQTRTCTNGSLSGSYGATSCTPGCTGTPWGNVSHGYSNTAYSSSLPTASCASVSETRTCSSGTLSGSYTTTSCTSGCTGTPWGNVISGFSGTAYQSGTVAAGSACAPISQTRTCTNGTLSGSYTNLNCTTVPYSPSITGPTTGEPATSYTFTFQATDDNSDTIHYEIDWDNNGTSDQTLPTGFISSGTSQNQANNWAAPGVKIFQARTVDSNGATSPWSTHTITISCAAGTYWGGGACLTPTGGISSTNPNPIVGEAFDMSIISSSAAICQIDRQLDGGPWTLNWDTKVPPYTWNGLTEVTSGTVVYRLTCYENIDKSGVQSAQSTVTLTVDTSSDLSIGGTVSPSSATLLVPVTFSGTVTNSGSASTGASFNSFFQLSNTPNGSGPYTDLPTINHGALGIGVSDTLTQNYTFSSIGAYSIRLCTDKSSSGDTGTITERPSGSAEGNNCSGWTNIDLTSMTGSLDISASTCTIPVGGSNCPLTFTWDTVDPYTVSAVVRNHPDNTILFSGNTELVGKTATITAEFPTVDYYLYNSGVELAHKVVTTSCASGGWNSADGVCADPQVLSAYSTGNYYVTPGSLNFTLGDATAYEIRNGSGVVVATGTDDGTGSLHVVSVTTTSDYSIYAIAGSYKGTTPWVVRYDSPPPPNATIALTIYPRTIVRNEQTTVSWDIKYPTNTCAVTAQVVCTNGRSYCNANQTAFETEVNNIITGSSTDANDPNTTRLISDALHYVAPGYGEPKYRALGKKTFTIRHSIDFTLTCDGIKKETRRAQVAQSQEI